jgi:hypothetical protein
MKAIKQLNNLVYMHLYFAEIQEKLGRIIFMKE